MFLPVGIGLCERECERGGPVDEGLVHMGGGECVCACV